MPVDRAEYDKWNQVVFNHYTAELQRYGGQLAYNTDWRLKMHEERNNHRPLVWGAENFWYEGHNVWHDHFAWIEDGDDAMLSFVASPAKGELGIRVKTRPGRYLTQFFGPRKYASILSYCRLSEKQIAYYAAWQNLGTQPPSAWDSYPLAFARTEEEIVRVYAKGPRSCMSIREGDVAFGLNPLRVYAAGDLAVAYLEGEPPMGQKDKSLTVMARAVVWPDKKVASRVYPTPFDSVWERDGFLDMADSQQCQDALRKKLRAENYRFIGEDQDATFAGARVQFIVHPRSGEALRPYFDGGFKAAFRGGAYVLT